MPSATQSTPQQSTAGPNLLGSIAAPAGDADRPDWRDPLFRAHASLWQKCRDAFEGTDALLANAPLYIPKHRKEKPEDYRIRCAHTACFNAYGAVIRGFTGLAFAKPAQLGDDVHPIIKAHAEDIDGRGLPLHDFAHAQLRELLTVGAALHLVLYPKRPANATAEDEQSGTLRPYWHSVRIEDIYSAQFTKYGAREHLTQLVFHEARQVRAKRFGTKTVHVFRVFTKDIDTDGLDAPVTFVDYELRKDANGKDVFVEVDQGALIGGTGKPLSRIPLIAVRVPDANTPFSGRPQLKDLLDLMLKAFRIDSDRTYLMHQACLPIPVRKGYQSKKDENGRPLPRQDVAAVNTLMDLPADTPAASGINFFWAEISGSALEPTAKELEKLKAEMGALGLSFLAPSTRAAETADARRLDARIENASLSSMMSLVDTAMEEGLIIHAEYQGVTVRESGEQSGGSFTTNRDFEQTILTSDMITVYSDMVLKDQITLETLYDILERGRSLPDGFDKQKEIAALRLLVGADTSRITDGAADQQGDAAGRTESASTATDDPARIADAAA